MYLPRWIEEDLRGLVQRHPVVVVTGARQTGKTTLLRHLFREPEWRYVTLDDLEMLDTARTAPRDLIARGGKQLVVDEVQRVPELLLAIKRAADEDRGLRFVLSGSANLLLMKKVSETLAGRAVLATLSPMTRGEMMGLPRSGLWGAALDPSGARELLAWVGGGIDLATAVPDSSLLAPANAPTRDVWIREAWRGGFPALLGQDDVAAAEWFDGFERTYLERDVMGLAGVSDIVPFRRAIRVAALQAGGILNVTDVARSVSLSAPTVSRYLDCIEVAMQGRRLPPLAASRRKRLIRSPKLYLADSGLHAHVCGLRDAGSLADSPLLGATMETWVLQQLDVAASRLKPAAEVGYWRTADGYEVDFVMERGDRLVGIEVKSGRGPSRADTRGLTMLREEVGDRFSLGVVLHGGTRAEILGERILALPAAYAGM